MAVFTQNSSIFTLLPLHKSHKVLEISHSRTMALFVMPFSSPVLMLATKPSPYLRLLNYIEIWSVCMRQGEIAGFVNPRWLSAWTDAWVGDSSTHTAYTYWGNLWRV